MKKAKTKSPKKAAAPKIGILGGSFNPPHFGHLDLALKAREDFDLSKVFFVPANKSPLRDPSTVGALDRLEMVKRAVEKNPVELGFDDLEIKKGGTSYSVDTLRTYSERYGSENLYFIVGADIFPQLPQWKNFGELLALSNFIVMTRPGYSLDMVRDELPQEILSLCKKIGKNSIDLVTGRKIYFSKSKDRDVSSSEVRDLIKSGKDASKCVSEKVMEYIKSRGLYLERSRTSRDFKALAEFCVERALDKKALDVRVYDLTSKNSFTDYTVVCSATSKKHSASIADGIIDSVKDNERLSALSVEGLSEGSWVLVDYGGVVVHVFEDAMRAKYNIDGLLKNYPLLNISFPGQAKAASLENSHL